MRLTWIFGVVVVLAAATTAWVWTAGRERQWQQERARVEVEGVIANLDPSPDVIYARSAPSELSRLRQCRYELSGTTGSADESNSGENRELRHAEQACEAVRELFLPERQKTPTAQYIHSHMEIYNNQIRPRLQDLSKSCHGDLAVAALRAMLAAGDDPAPLIARAQEMYLTEDDYSSAAMFLGLLHRPLPVEPSDPSVLGVYADTAQKAGPAALPSGAVFCLDDARLRHGGKITALSFSADGSELISGSENGEAAIWSVSTAQCLSRWNFSIRNESSWVTKCSNS
jgi:hypothetical protein